MSNEAISPSPGVALFEQPCADHEAAWLSAVFVQPRAYSSLTTMRSIAIFGASGAGTSALQQALTRDAEAAGRLVADWTPTLLHNVRGTPAVRAYMRQVMACWSVALLRYVGQHPDCFAMAPAWVQDALTWILQTRLPGNWAFHLSKVADQTPSEGYELLRQLEGRTPEPGFDPDSVDGHLIRELAALLPEIGISGTWIMLNATQPWLQLEEGALGALLDDMASTLTHFETPGVAWRFFLPSRFTAQMARTAAAARGRLAHYTLEWTLPALEQLVEQRLKTAFGRDEMTLAELAEGAPMLAYLQRYGGTTPRGWLDLLRPFVAAYQRAEPPRPLTICEWDRVRTGALPPLRLRPAQDRVMVGQRVIDELTSSLKQLLFYLYDCPAQRCERSELYFVGYRGFDIEHYAAMSEEERGETWEHPDGWGPVLDTALWRLRRALEWDSRNPQYILSERGATRAQGEVWLDHIL